MTPTCWTYVEALRATGLYGDTTSSVLRELVLESIRRAVADGLIARAP